MPWPKTGTTHYHAQLGLPDKGRAIKELVVYRVLLNLIPRVFGQKSREAASIYWPRRPTYLFPSVQTDISDRDPVTIKDNMHSMDLMMLVCAEEK